MSGETHGKKFNLQRGFGRGIEESPQTKQTMKRIGNLFEKVVALDNLILADEIARKGKLKTYGVRHHDQNRESNLLKLQKMLINGEYHTSEYHIFTIFEPKEREIFRLPYFPDRIVHHAIMNVVEPIWVSIFTKDTYSCIKARGIHACAQSVRKVMKEDRAGTRYCLKLDIRKFYPSIDHEILKQIIRRKIKDNRLLALLDEIIDSVPSGVPIGNYLSQYFANLYLAYFDHWIKEEKGVKYYWRYADDIVILAPDKDSLHDLCHDIRKYLATLKLRIKRNYQVFPVDSRGIDFVGYVFRHTHTRLRKSIKKNLCRRVARLEKNPPKSRREYMQEVAAWWGWLKYCDSINLINKLQNRIPYEIRFKGKCKRVALRCVERETRDSGKGQ